MSKLGGTNMSTKALIASQRGRALEELRGVEERARGVAQRGAALLCRRCCELARRVPCRCCALIAQLSARSTSDGSRGCHEDALTTRALLAVLSKGRVCVGQPNALELERAHLEWAGWEDKG